MRRALLLGAGFSHNLGGILANDVFDFLIGSSHLDEGLRQHLWRFQRNGGFEAALAALQDDHRLRSNSITARNLERFQNALVEMFDSMDKAFSITPFEFQDNLFYSVELFLTRFDVIFTLNQDVLLERYYLNQGYTVGTSRRHGGANNIPGMIEIPGTTPDPSRPNLCMMQPAPSSSFNIQPGNQPYIKLHGSSNWKDGSALPLLVMGGNKPDTISSYPILVGYHRFFSDFLLQPDTLLVVIGYGFGDTHINQAIRQAAQRKTISLFVIDPLGTDAFDENRNAALYTPSALAGELQGCSIGASKRPLREVFGGNKVEHLKIMRFLP